MFSSKNGETWTQMICFVQEFEYLNKSSTYPLLTHDELHAKLKDLVNAKEEIKSVAIYKLPFPEKYFTNLMWRNHIVVIETETWWWSIEKNDHELTIQRSTQKFEVLKRYRNKVRITSNYWDVSQLVMEDEGNRTMGDLIDWLYINRELKKGYGLYHGSSKTFTQTVFNYIAKQKSVWSWF